MFPKVLFNVSGVPREEKHLETLVYAEAIIPTLAWWDWGNPWGKHDMLSPWCFEFVHTFTHSHAPSRCNSYLHSPAPSCSNFPPHTHVITLSPLSLHLTLKRWQQWAGTWVRTLRSTIMTVFLFSRGECQDGALSKDLTDTFPNLYLTHPSLS